MAGGKGEHIIRKCEICGIETFVPVYIKNAANAEFERPVAIEIAERNPICKGCLDRETNHLREQ